MFFEAQKYYLVFESQFNCFFSNDHICNVVSTLPNVVKTKVENGNIVSSLCNVIQCNVEIHNVVSTLLNVLNYNDAVCNVVSTVLWRCATPWSNINLKTTLKRRWNVSCEILLFLLYILQMLTQLKRKGVGETFLYDGKLYVG